MQQITHRQNKTVTKIQANEMKKITQNNTEINQLNFSTQIFLKVPFCRIVEPFNANKDVKPQTHKESELLQATMTNMNVCVKPVIFTSSKI